jgi:hypothetical protein
MLLNHTTNNRVQAKSWSKFQNIGGTNPYASAIKIFGNASPLLPVIATHELLSCVFAGMVHIFYFVWLNIYMYIYCNKNPVFSNIIFIACIFVMI